MVPTLSTVVEMFSSSTFFLWWFFLSRTIFIRRSIYYLNHAFCGILKFPIYLGFIISINNTTSFILTIKSLFIGSTFIQFIVFLLILFSTDINKYFVTGYNPSIVSLLTNSDLTTVIILCSNYGFNDVQISDY